MEKGSNLILNAHQISQRINRIAYQIYEDNFNEKEIIIIGIRSNGYVLAQKIAESLGKICKIKITLAELIIDKTNHMKEEASISIDTADVKGKSVVLIDDVLNSGKTLIYSMKTLLDIDIKKLRTALMVDRDHKRYPVNANFVGMTLSTTMQEHVTVEFGKQARVYLS